MFNVDFADLAQKAKQIEAFMSTKEDCDNMQTHLLIEIRDALLEMDKTLTNLVKMLLIKEGYFPSRKDNDNG